MLKSAWELSQEKAAAIDGRKDEEIALTEKQKIEIGETRRQCKAKIAEKEVMLQGKFEEAFQDGAGYDYIEQLKEEFNKEKRTLIEEQDKKIEAIKKQ